MVLPHLGQASRGSAYRCVLEPQANQVKDVKINAWLQASHQLRLYARGLAIRIAALNTLNRASKYRPDFCHKALLAVRRRLQLPFRFIVVEARLRGSLASSVLVPFGVGNGTLGVGSETGAAEEGGSQLRQKILCFVAHEARCRTWVKFSQNIPTYCGSLLNVTDRVLTSRATKLG